MFPLRDSVRVIEVGDRGRMSERLGPLMVHVLAVAPVLVRGRRLEADLVFEDAGRRVDHAPAWRAAERPGKDILSGAAVRRSRMG